MRISYGKINVIFLLLALLMGGAILVGVYMLHVVPLQDEKEAVKLQLQHAEQLLQVQKEVHNQIDVLEGITTIIDDLETQIPVSDIQIRNLLLTLEAAANGASVDIKQIQVSETSTIIGSAPEEDVVDGVTEENEKEISTLTKTTMTVTLEGNREPQLQSFIRKLEQSDRLIQVEHIDVEQTTRIIRTIEERPVPEQESNNGEEEPEEENDSTGSEPEKSNEIEMEEIVIENMEDVMNATITIVVYFTK